MSRGTFTSIDASAGFPARGLTFMVTSSNSVVTFLSYDLRCKSRVQSRANKDQHGRGQEDDSIVATQSEAARAAGERQLYSNTCASLDRRGTKNVDCAAYSGGRALRGDEAPFATSFDRRITGHYDLDVTAQLTAAADGFAAACAEDRV